MTYYVYENYPNNRATVHAGSCRYATKPRVMGIISTTTGAGRWFGPYETKEGAVMKAHGTDRMYRECSFCNP